MHVKKMAVMAFMVMILSACASLDVQNSSDGRKFRAPDFTLPDQDGKDVTLSEVLANHRGVVLAFYPKDDSRN